MTNILASNLAENCTCGILVHPDISLEVNVYGGQLADLFGRVSKPILLLPTKVIFVQLFLCEFTSFVLLL